MERFSRDISAKRLTVGMIMKEFLAQRLAHLHAHSRPLWEYWASNNKLMLWSWDLPTEDLSRVFAILLGGDPGDLPEALGSLYRCHDRNDLVAAMPVFNERGLLSAEGSGPPQTPPVRGARRRPSATTRSAFPSRHNPSFCVSTSMMDPLLPGQGLQGSCADSARQAVCVHARLPEARG
ncbi:hypothetical protein D1007_14866 [Hordeum vulgare]|nr:hypothetical protein D1007_14866 [Hordeum vulgare]